MYGYIEKNRFPAAARSHQHQKFTFSYLQVKTVQHHNLIGYGAFVVHLLTPFELKFLFHALCYYFVHNEPFPIC